MPPKSAITSDTTTRWINPLTIGIVFCFIGYCVICAVLSSFSSDGIRQFLQYVTLLAYPAEIPYDALSNHFDLLDDPRSRHSWQWYEFASAALLIAVTCSVLCSALLRDHGARKISVRLGLPLVGLWYLGAVVLILLHGIH